MSTSVINATFTFFEGLFHVANVSDTIRWMDLVAKTRQVASPIIFALSQTLERALPLLEPVSAIDKFCTLGRKITDYSMTKQQILKTNASASAGSSSSVSDEESYSKLKPVNITSCFFDAVSKSCSALSVLSGVAFRVGLKTLKGLSCVGLVCDVGRAATAMILHIRDVITDLNTTTMKGLFAHTILLIKEAVLFSLACIGIVMAFSVSINPFVLIGLGVVPLLFEPITKNLVDKFGSSAS